jgi:hypothetical protein
MALNVAAPRLIAVVSQCNEHFVVVFTQALIKPRPPNTASCSFWFSFGFFIDIFSTHAIAACDSQILLFDGRQLELPGGKIS